MRDGDGRIGGGGPGRIGGMKVSAFDLAEVLSDYLDRPVLDETGIDGLFDFKLIWTPDETPREQNPAEQHPPVDPNGASIFEAVQEQLGLRLVPQKRRGRDAGNRPRRQSAGGKLGECGHRLMRRQKQNRKGFPPGVAISFGPWDRLADKKVIRTWRLSNRVGFNETPY